MFRAGTLPLMDPDESRCAQIAAEMERSGDWLVPHFEGEVYFDKPAPFFWLTVVARKLTGNMELSGRLVASLAGIAAVLTTYAVGQRVFGATAGLLGGLILATSIEFLFIARWFRMDMPFTAAMWAAVWWFLRGESLFAADGNWEHRRRGWVGFYFFCATATLFKGPAGLPMGAQIVGPHAVETIHEVALAKRHGLTVRDLAETVHAHPTVSEVIKAAAIDAAGKCE